MSELLEIAKRSQRYLKAVIAVTEEEICGMESVLKHPRSDEWGNVIFLKEQQEILANTTAAIQRVEDAAVRDKDGNIIKPDANGWYPIGCAPGGHTTVMVYINYAEPIEEAYYDDDNEKWCSLRDGDFSDNFQPTLWRPTFNPPVKEGRK